MQTFAHAASSLLHVRDLSAFAQDMDDVLGLEIQVTDVALNQVQMTSSSNWSLQKGEEEDVDLGELFKAHIPEGAVLHLKWVSVHGTSVMGGLISIGSDGETQSQSLAGLEDYANATLGLAEVDSPEELMNRVDPDVPV